MKVFELPQIQMSLMALGGVKLPAYPAAYRVGKALRAVGRANNHYQAKISELYRLYGVLNEEGTHYVKPSEAEAAATFDKHWTELMHTDVDVELQPVSFDMLGDATIEPVHVAVLDGLMLTDIPETTVTINDDKENRDECND